MLWRIKNEERISLSSYVRYEDITRPQKVSFHPRRNWVNNSTSCTYIIPLVVVNTFDWYNHLNYPRIYINISDSNIGTRKYDLWRSAHARVRHASRGSQPPPIGHNRDRRKSRTMGGLCNGIRRLPMTVIRERERARARVNNGINNTESLAEERMEENENTMHTPED